MSCLLDLFDNGQFAAASDQLTNITGHTTDLTTQLATENNAAVLAYIQLKAQRTSSDADLFKWKFENCLQNCAGVPARVGVLTVELASLYNHTYLSLVHAIPACRHLKLWHRSLIRVCRVFHPRKTKLNYDCDEKSACVSLIRQCLKAIGVASACGYMPVCCLLARCVWLWCIQETRINNHTEAEQLLHTLADAINKTDFLVTGDYPVLTFPLYADHIQLPVTPGLEGPLSSVLWVVSLSGNTRYDQVVSVLDTVKDQHLAPSVKFLSGFASYKLGQYTEGISTLMEIVRSQPPATPRLRARVHFLIGLCFTKLDKRPLGLAMFREALCADFSFLRPLYTTALQYRSFGDNDMELECLNLLTMALEMRDSPGLPVTSGVDVLSLVDFEDEDITYPTALYTLASRALKLHKFDVAAEKYTILLQHLRTGTVQSEDLPPVLQLYHETMEATLGSGKYKDCLKLCDHVLACYHGNAVSMDTTYDPSQGSSHSGEFTDELPRAGDVIDFVYNKRVVNKNFSQNSKNNEDLSNNGEEMETSCSGQSLKRKYSEDRASECHHGDTDVVALKFKALALHKIGKIEDALICLKRAIQSISDMRRQKMRAVMGSSSEPQSKRRKIQEPGANGKKMSDKDSTLRDDNSIEKLNVTKGSSAKLNSGENKFAGLHGTSLELECELYEMTSNILDSLKKSKDAAHFRRLSTELKSCFKV
ncbi:uncharacterized protein LOC128239301 [Mya arenaria]|uniref:uncharacterized protein LOC128239301 n=1 Tax=Mya arenaria TaxID=6604 RepID=UPI0022E76B8D|nr:uncharacterized protein LOC128239301 [Mya arenaria]XP_052811853.1 uncharacterized protein LOC128239301 [Mya arenaria]